MVKRSGESFSTPPRACPQPLGDRRLETPYICSVTFRQSRWGHLWATCFHSSLQASLFEVRRAHSPLGQNRRSSARPQAHAAIENVPRFQPVVIQSYFAVGAGLRGSQDLVSGGLAVESAERGEGSTTASSGRPSYPPRSIMPRARISASSFPPNTRTARSRLTAILRWRGRSRPIRISKSIPVRQCDAASHARRAHRVSVPANPLGLHRPLAVGDRFRRRHLSDLRQTGASR